MVQLAPDLAQLTRWAMAQGLLPARGEADIGYTLHAALAAAFGELAPKPFTLTSGRVTRLLGYTPHAGAALRDHAASFADPELHALLGVDGLADKTMPERFAAGQRLGFSVRARPTIRADRDGDRDRVVERDAFLLSPPGSDRGHVYAEWLGRQLSAGGAEARQIGLDAFQLTRVQRRRADRAFRQTLGPDATFSGVLTVLDPDMFDGLLTRGVGRHRAFGFGMLLLRPP